MLLVFKLQLPPTLIRLAVRKFLLKNAAAMLTTTASVVAVECEGDVLAWKGGLLAKVAVAISTKMAVATSEAAAEEEVTCLSAAEVPLKQSDSRERLQLAFNSSFLRPCFIRGPGAQKSRKPDYSYDCLLA